MNICSQCLEVIPDDELCFEAESLSDSKKGKITLCRLCFYGSPYVSDKMKREFAYYERKERG